MGLDFNPIWVYRCGGGLYDLLLYFRLVAWGLLAWIE
jgi:hypothetical protein